MTVKSDDFTSGTIACERALLLGESREVTREPHAKGDASVRRGEKRKVLLFLHPSSPARSLAARFAYHSNGELPRRLAVQGMWIYTGGSDGSMSGGLFRINHKQLK